MRVLVLEDESSLRDILSLILEDFGYLVDEAETLEEARSKLEAEEYDLLLLTLGFQMVLEWSW